MDAAFKSKTRLPHHLAPEILRGEPCTEASDVFAFGMLLWDMVNAPPPLENRSLAQYFGIMAYDKLFSLPAPTRVPSHLKSLVNRCLSHDPAARPRLAQIIEELDKGEKQPRN